MDDETYQIPTKVIDAIEDGTPAIRAFSENDGRSAADVAAAAGISEKRMAVLEKGADSAKAAELDALAEVLDVPRDLLIDE